ncbi:MAG: MFS transporter [Bacteroidota bacterium]
MENSQKIWTKDFILMCIVALFLSVAFYFLIPTLPGYLACLLKADNTDIGIILSIYTVSALLIRPVTGYAIDRYGRKMIYLISFFIFSLMFGGYAIAGTFVFFLLLRFAHGLMWGITTTTSSTIIVDIVPYQRRGEGLGYYGLAMTISMALGPFLAVIIVGKSMNYDALFISSMLLGMAGVILAMFVTYPGTHANKATPSFSIASLFEKRSFVLSLNIFILMISYGGLISFITLYGKEIGVDYPGNFFISFAAGVLISRMTSGKIFDKYGPSLIVPLGIILLIAGFPVLALVKTLIGYFLSAFILGMGVGIIFPTSQAITNNLVEKERRGVANSTLFTAYDLGIGTGMFVIGYISDTIGLANSFILGSIINTMGLAYFFLFTLPYYKKHHFIEK